MKSSLMQKYEYYAMFRAENTSILPFAKRTKITYKMQDQKKHLALLLFFLQKKAMFLVKNDI